MSTGPSESYDHVDCNCDGCLRVRGEALRQLSHEEIDLLFIAMAINALEYVFGLIWRQHAFVRFANASAASVRVWNRRTEAYHTLCVYFKDNTSEWIVYHATQAGIGHDSLAKHAQFKRAEDTARAHETARWAAVEFAMAELEEAVR